MTLKNRGRLIAVALVASVLLALPLAYAQDDTQPAPEADTAETTGPGEKPAEPARDEDDERVRLEWADDFYYDEDEATYYLTGNVQILHKGVRIYADKAEYYEDTDTAKATGNLKAVDPEATITGDLVEADFDGEVIVVTGNVRIVAQKKPDEDAEDADGDTQADEEQDAADTEEDGEPEDFEQYAEKRTVISCDRLEYQYNEDIETGIATGNVKAVQEDKTVWADKAVYERIPDIITLTGHVRFVRENGDEGRSPKVVISTEEDWIRAESVRGITLRRSDEDETEE